MRRKLGRRLRLDSTAISSTPGRVMRAKRGSKVNVLRAKKKNSPEIGYDLTDVAVKSWNSQSNPPKVYIDDNRIHHGTVGVGLTAGGIIGLIISAFSDDAKTKKTITDVSGFLIGSGVRLMEDDIADAPDWFNFKEDTIPVNQVQFPNSIDYNYSIGMA